jgi:2-haloacid dehalogenase
MKEYDNLGTFSDVEKGLATLRQDPNVTCVVFSNGTKDMVSNSVHSSEALKSSSSTFADIVTVDQVRLFKPHPKVYRYLAERVGMENDIGSLWLVSSNPFDVVGARAVGMQAAWVDRTGNGWQDKLAGSPTVVCKGIDEVAAAVAK